MKSASVHNIFDFLLLSLSLRLAHLPKKVIQEGLDLNMNPYFNQQQQPRPSYRPNRASMPAQLSPYQSSSVVVDSATLERYKMLELKSAGMESKYENQIIELHRKLEESMLLLAKTNSLLESEQNEKWRISQQLANEQTQERLTWAAEKEKLIEQQNVQKEGLDESQQIQKLAAHLKIEQDNNIRFSKYLEQLNQQNQKSFQEQAKIQEELRVQLDDEKKANVLLDENFRVLILKMNDTRQSTPSLAPKIDGAEQDYLSLTETLKKEREAFELSLSKKQHEIFALNQQLEIKSRPDQQLYDRFIDLQEQNTSLQKKLDRLNYTNEETQKLLKNYQAKDAVIFLANNLPPQSAPLKLPKDYSMELFELFVKAGDLKCTGKLDAFQLQTTLSYGPWPPLSLKTVAVLSRFSEGEFTDLTGFKIIYDWISLCKLVFANFDSAREKENVWGYIQLDGFPKFREILSQLKITLHQNAASIIMKRLQLDGISCSWDQMVYATSILKVWDLEFSKLDLDQDQAITIFHQAFMVTVAKCIP